MGAPGRASCDYGGFWGILGGFWGISGRISGGISGGILGGFCNDLRRIMGCDYVGFCNDLRRIMGCDYVGEGMRDFRERGDVHIIIIFDSTFVENLYILSYLFAIFSWRICAAYHYVWRYFRTDYHNCWPYFLTANVRIIRIVGRIFVEKCADYHFRGKIKVIIIFDRGEWDYHIFCCMFCRPSKGDRDICD